MGALGMLKVEGDERRELYSGKQADTIYRADAAPANVALSMASATPPGAPLSKEAQIAAGHALFPGTCEACHQLDGKGLPNAFPLGQCRLFPLANM